MKARVRAVARRFAAFLANDTLVITLVSLLLAAFVALASAMGYGSIDRYLAVEGLVGSAGLAMLLGLGRQVVNARRKQRNRTATSIAIEAHRPQTRLAGARRSAEPLVSVIIPLGSETGKLEDCVNSIWRGACENIHTEIIVVGEESSLKGLAHFSGLQTVAAKGDAETPSLCNLGAAHAKGKHLLFLDGNAWLLPETLRELFASGEKENVGVVAGRVVLPDAKLKNAGAFVSCKGQVVEFGNGDNSDAHDYTYVRPVTGCSISAMFTSKALFQRLGGFDERYSLPAYAGMDYCLKAGALNLEVQYNPFALIVQKTCQSEADPEGKDQSLLNERWPEEFVGEDNLQRGLEKIPSPRVLVVNDIIPTPDQDSGSLRLSKIIESLQELGCSVGILPIKHEHERRYFERNQRQGIHVIYPPNDSVDLKCEAARYAAHYDIVWVCKVGQCDEVFDLFSRSKAKIVYDTVDLHYVRERRESELTGIPNGWEETKQKELGYCHRSDRCIVVTEDEKQVLEKEGLRNVSVIGNIHQLYEGERPPFEQREGILFIGSYWHEPNVDAVVWLCNEVLPIVFERLGKVKVTLLGSNPDERVLALQSDTIHIPGFLENVDDFFLNSKVFVAPLRFGAGMKGKLGHAFTFGLPSVSTSIGAEGMHLVDGKHVAIADDSESFAAKIVEVYSNREVWTTLGEGGYEAARAWTKPVVKASLDRILAEIKSK